MRSVFAILIAILLAGFAFGTAFRMSQQMPKMPHEGTDITCVTHCLFTKAVIASGDAGSISIVTWTFTAVAMTFVVPIALQRIVFLPSVVPRDARRILTVIKRE